MPKTTLRKIAKSLNLSVATVSKALKDYPDISAKTKERVKNLAEKLNYKPNSYAQSLRNQESKIIGLIIPELVHHFFANIALGVIKAAEKEGYLVITLQSDESYEIEKNQIKLLLDKNVDGILLSLADNTVDHKHVANIIENNVPVVLYDKISKLINCHKVVIDDQKAAYNATKHLIDSGYKNIAHIRGPLKPQTTIDRFKGYKKALEDHNIIYDKNLVFETAGLSFKDGRISGEKILKSNKKIDAVFAMTDLLATGVLVVVKEAGLNIPNDIAIIGFSNWFLTKITTPMLSTVDQPGYKMGEEAFKMLLKELNDNKKGVAPDYKVIEIPTEVIVRNSTKTIA